MCKRNLKKAIHQTSKQQHMFIGLQEYITFFHFRL